jgi:nucleoside-diphosphate kinase
MNQTLAIIKPDAVGSGNTGKIIAQLENSGFSIKAIKLTVLNREQAGTFYSVHEGKTFYEGLIDFMTSGPVIPMVLEADAAVEKLREVIGATDPAEAAEGTVRNLYAESKGRNAIHASDSNENAQVEIDFFFSQNER